MILKIYDILGQTLREIENPEFIPRIGEKIKSNYEPSPTVKEVIYKFEEDEIIIIIS
jgi:hypothetical protein